MPQRTLRNAQTKDSTFLTPSTDGTALYCGLGPAFALLADRLRRHPDAAHSALTALVHPIDWTSPTWRHPCTGEVLDVASGAHHVLALLPDERFGKFQRFLDRHLR